MASRKRKSKHSRSHIDAKRARMRLTRSTESETGKLPPLIRFKVQDSRYNVCGGGKESVQHAILCSYIKALQFQSIRRYMQFRFQSTLFVAGEERACVQTVNETLRGRKSREAESRAAGAAEQERQQVRDSRAAGQQRREMDDSTL